METMIENLMHAGRIARHRRSRNRGLKKARCVRRCKAAKGKFKRGKHTLGACRKRCHVKKK